MIAVIHSCQLILKDKNLQGGNDMKALEINDWMTLNTIIYEIYTTENLTEMRENFLERMKTVLDFDSADFHLATTDGKNGLTNPVFYNCKEDFSHNYEDIDYSRGIMYGNESIVYRETDIMSDEVRVNTEYYKRVYMPNKWHYSLQMILMKDKVFLGAVTFYRFKGRENFKYEDVFILNMLKEHMAFRLDKDRVIEEEPVDKLTVTEASIKFELTRRETDILKMLMDGKDNEMICDELCISVNTLKKHIRNIYVKLGIKKRVQLFKMIRERE